MVGTRRNWFADDVTADLSAKHCIWKYPDFAMPEVISTAESLLR
jgi:hypothetical protein